LLWNFDGLRCDCDCHATDGEKVENIRPQDPAENDVTLALDRRDDPCDQLRHRRANRNDRQTDDDVGDAELTCEFSGVVDQDMRPRNDNGNSNKREQNREKNRP